ncbi:MAG: hypothetical protein HYZ00_05550, partial [Candidatus Hydrogenedentes bacterium]|nr:hypothetical protein [Candidatus Hydrogenedentota bacterium]
MEKQEAIPRYITRDAAALLVTRLGDDFVVIQNPGYVHPPYEICPLAPRRRSLDEGVRAFLVDMDGTITTTEDLCLHALETMVRRATGWGIEQWRGLDPVRDFPHIIGNSTTQNAEYLVDIYGHGINPKLLLGGFLEAVAWTLGKGQSHTRKDEAQAHLAALGMQPVLEDSRFTLLRFTAFTGSPEARSALNSLVDKFAAMFPLQGRGERVRAGVEIYYQRLHQMFSL